MRSKGRATFGQKEKQAAGERASQVVLVSPVQEHMPTARAMAFPEQVSCGSGAFRSADGAGSGGTAKAVLWDTKGKTGEHVPTA